MYAYYDTGVLVPLYVREVFSDTVIAYMVGRDEAIPISLFHRLELENALQLRVFRGDMTEDRCNEIRQKLDGNMAEGRLVLRPVNWVTALEKARSLSERVTVRTGCRTLDLIHVAIAAQWGCSLFVTADERQLAAAKAEGLRTVDVRALHRRHGDGRGASGSVVSERRPRYGTKKRPRKG